MAAVLLCAPLVWASAPAASQGSATEPALDPALVARAADAFYQRELARTRRTHTVNDDRRMLERARGAGERLIPHAKAAATAPTEWSWALNMETRPEPIAWCLPNGQIWVSTGLIQGLALTDAELSAIIAHAIAHALRGDDLREMASAYRRTRADPDPDPNRAMTELADILARKIAAPNYDAETEKAADALSVELIARSGVNPRAAASAWRKVGQSAFTSPPGLRALHPVTAERLAALDTQAAAAVPLYDAARAAAAAAPKRPPQTMQSNPSLPKDARKPQSPYGDPPPRPKGSPTS
jgi:Zn-dependent protease with chaperone function